jgi:hypothetical protein
VNFFTPFVVLHCDTGQYIHLTKNEHLLHYGKQELIGEHIDMLIPYQISTDKKKYGFQIVNNRFKNIIAFEGNIVTPHSDAEGVHEEGGYG